MKRKPGECFTYISTLLSNKSEISHEYKGYIFCKLWYKFGYSLENKCSSKIRYTNFRNVIFQNYLWNIFNNVVQKF